MTMNIRRINTWDYSRADHPTPLAIRIDIGPWTIGLGIKRSMAEQKWFFYGKTRRTLNWQFGPFMLGIKKDGWDFYHRAFSRTIGEGPEEQ